VPSPTADALRGWIGDILHHGAGRSDAILAAYAHRATLAGDHARLVEIADLAYALQPSRERRLEAGAQGKAFAAAIDATWSAPSLAALGAALKPIPVTYAVAVAAAAADHAIPETLTLEAYLSAFVANLVSVAIRAVPLGQTDGQRVIRDLAPVAVGVAARALGACLDDLGSAAFRADIASMHHETQYTRLFRS
jgi:urease accessory protein